MYTTITAIALRNNNYNFQTNNPLEKMDLKVHYDSVRPTESFKYQVQGVSTSNHYTKVSNQESIIIVKISEVVKI